MDLHGILIVLAFDHLPPGLEDCRNLVKAALHTDLHIIWILGYGNAYGIEKSIELGFHRVTLHKYNNSFS